MDVALCGYGPMGRTHARLLGRHEGVRLTGVADAREELRASASELEGVRVFASGEELIDAGIADVVFVCAPTYLHAPLAIRALQAGAHVFCEKPMALSHERCRAMQSAATRAGRFLMIGQVLRFWPEYVFLRDTIRSGELGRLETLSLQRIGGVSVGYEGWFLDEDRGGMQIFDRHLHDTDLVLWLLGRPRRVAAHGTLKDRHTQGGYVHTFTRYEYDGCTVMAEGSADLPKGFPFSMSYLAVFERGAIEYCNRHSPTLTVYDGNAPVHPELPQPLGAIGSGLNIGTADAYFLEQVYFLECVRTGTPPTIVTPEDAALTVEVARAEILSADRGTPVELG